MKLGLAACLLILILAGCSGPGLSGDISTPVDISTSNPAPTAAPATIQELHPTPTTSQWLPYDPNPSRAGCSDFVATLDGKGLEGSSQEQIFKQLFEVYLAHFRSPDLGGICRLENYQVESILVDQKIAFLAAEQHLDRVAWVEFSVQVSSEPTEWVAGNGELAAGGWVSHKALIVGYTRNDTGYILKVIGTGP